MAVSPEKRELRLLRYEGDKLNKKAKEQAKGLRGTKSKLTRLRKRTEKMLRELHRTIRPKLKTGRLKKFDDAIEPVRRLLGLDLDEE